MSRPLPIILLAPSEDKAHGGKLGTLQENSVQKALRLSIQSKIKGASLKVLEKELGAKGPLLQEVIRHMSTLPKGPLMQALERYQGVAFEALHADTLARDRWKQVCIFSNLRGFLRGDEITPFYKMQLGTFGLAKKIWSDHAEENLKNIPKGETWALLPQEYLKLLKGWDRPFHTLNIIDKNGRTISHWSKYYRGLIARWILESNNGSPDLIFKSTLKKIKWKKSENNLFGGKELTIVTM